MQEWVNFSELFVVHSSRYTFRSGLTTVWQLHLSWQDISDSCVYVEYMVFVPLCPAFSPNKEGKHFSYKTVGLFGLGWGKLSRKSTGRGNYQGNYPLGSYWWIEELLFINKSLFLTRQSASPCQNLAYKDLCRKHLPTIKQDCTSSLPEADWVLTTCAGWEDEKKRCSEGCSGWMTLVLSLPKIWLYCKWFSASNYFCIITHLHSRIVSMVMKQKQLKEFKVRGEKLPVQSPSKSDKQGGSPQERKVGGCHRCNGQGLA